MNYLDALVTEFSRAYKMPTEHIEKVFQQSKELEEDETFAYWRAVESLKQETRSK